ncbi:MAG: hypothetical protein AAF226_09550, partial [Verrucomicrobiota bacterium]
MKYVFEFVNGWVLWTAVVFGSIHSSAEDQLSQAQEIFDQYQFEALAVNRNLHLVCWRAADTDYPKGQQARISRMMLDIQSFYADEMERLGFGRITFNLDLDDKGR